MRYGQIFVIFTVSYIIAHPSIVCFDINPLCRVFCMKATVIKLMKEIHIYESYAYVIYCGV
jgi:hypothetical protein